MNRFVVIVMTDSRSDSESVVSAVSALGQDKDVEQQAMLDQLASERDYAATAAADYAASRVREEHHRGIGFMKFKEKLDAGETKTVLAHALRLFSVTALQVEAECASYFHIENIRYAEPGSLLPNKVVDFRANSSPVPAAVFSDEGAGGPVFDFECTSADIVVSNTGKKPRTFRARMLGFYKLSDSPVPLTRFASQASAERSSTSAPAGFYSPGPPFDFGPNPFTK